MEIAGLCAICEGVAKPAYSCRFCGAIVCRKCFDSDLGLCIKCASRIKRFK
jgi:hypothetical protein